VGESKGLFGISTNFVNNFVEKPGLDIAKTRQDAGFNKLPKRRAMPNTSKINDLRAFPQTGPQQCWN